MIEQKIERIEELNKQIIEEFKSLLILVEEKQEEYLDKIKTVKSYISDFTFGDIKLVSEKVSKKISRKGRPKGSLKYTKEHIDFLRGVSNLSDIEIVEKFNKKFGTSIKLEGRQLYNLMLRERIPFQREVTYKERKKAQRYPLEMYDFIKKNMDKMGNIVLCEEIKKEFGIDLTPQRLAPYMTYKGLKRKTRIYGRGYDDKGVYDNSRKESKYDIGIKHFSKHDEYLCNPSIKANMEKLTDKWAEVTCDNCKAKKEHTEFMEKIKKTPIKVKEKPSVEKKESQPKIYTKERIDFLRKSYENSDLSREEITDLFNEKFNLDINMGAISTVLKDNKIKKNKDFKVKSRKKTGRPSLIYTKKVVDFMKICASKNMNKSQAIEECQKEFEMGFKRSSFGQIAVKHNIRFAISNLLSIKDIPEEVQDFIKKNLKKDIYELRDSIIEKFELNYSIKRINAVVLKFKVKTDSKESQESETKRINRLRNKYEKDEDEDLPILPPEEEF